MTFKEELENRLRHESNPGHTCSKLIAPQKMCNCGRDDTITSIINLVDKEVIGEDKEKQHVFIRKPSHGNCCTCQVCGEPHDECILSQMLDEDELRAEQRAIIREEKTS